jgi:menaquinone-dependent protoporphyrinogen IX oxidase
MLDSTPIMREDWYRKVRDFDPKNKEAGKKAADEVLDQLLKYDDESRKQDTKNYFLKRVQESDAKSAAAPLLNGGVKMEVSNSSNSYVNSSSLPARDLSHQDQSASIA